MYSCLDCLDILEVPTVGAAARCATKHRKAGFKALYAIYCGVKLQTAQPSQNPLAALLAGTDMPLSPKGITIALAHGAPIGTITASIVEAAQWGLLGYFGDSMRGEMNRQDAITHIAGSCEMPTLANNTWRAMFMFTKVGGSGNNEDYDMIQKILTNQKAYHLVAVECSETGDITGGVVFPAGTYVFSEYGFNRPQDGIKEFVTRSFAIDYVQLMEQKSYAFPVYPDLEAVFQ